MLSPEMLLGQRYRLLERIAVGGMGEVWRASDTVLEREVAVKAMLPALLSEPGFAKRFVVEAKTVAALTHPAIVSVHDYGEAPLPSGDTTAYLVMEYVQGQSLADILSQRGALPANELMPIIASIADALQHAHDRGIIHRDIKPGNILVRTSDGQAVLTDFGIARSGSAGDLTATGAVMGTASYLAPEQAEGTGVLPASDMYSLGVVAFHGLTGRRPFDAENPIELALHHVRTPTPPLPPQLQPGVRAFVERAMTKDPSQRFGSCTDMAAAARASLTDNPPTSIMANALPQRSPGAGVVPVGGPLAGVAEPSPVTGPSPAHQVNLGAPLPPGPAPRQGVNKALLATLAGIVALVIVGGMVILLMQGFGDGGDGADDDPTGDTESEQTSEEVTDEQESPEPSETEDPDNQQTDDGGGPGGCLDPALCDR
ncbi:serine/threonine-protein kinase [Glycomyces buryatensis]|uniref:non-specific serine/threonine protein kinase n=1 Tax=Glycomyces buryatensis TaxID=2570927 RepID=A0A4S8PVF1_9ACTN|nr:serine/threonine-protein kinase [Glycomyces buryatensis]THV33925.1 serine/threonine protein kinase [Glycomyces buryatensis]